MHRNAVATATVALAIGVAGVLAPQADATKQRSAPRANPIVENQSYFCDAVQSGYNDAITDEQSFQLEIDGQSSASGPSSQDYMNVGNSMGCPTGMW